MAWGGGDTGGNSSYALETGTGEKTGGICVGEKKLEIGKNSVTRAHIRRKSQREGSHHLGRK